MTRITHLPCPNCGSSDALTQYANADHCFSCGWHKNNLNQTSLFDKKQRNNTEQMLPHLTSELPKDALQWLLKAYIFKDDLVNIGILYNTEDKRIMLPLPGVGSYQGRSLSKYETKYKTYGTASYPIFGEYSEIVFLVEDWLSGYRIGKHSHAICTLGTSPKLKQLVAEIGRSWPKKIVIWYDSDTPGRQAAYKLKKKLEFNGYTNVKDFYTQKDPKHLGLNELKDIIGSFYDNRTVAP